MPLYRRGAPFQRNSVERRSLRWKPSSGLTVVKVNSHRRSGRVPAVARTSLDLELDRRAQLSRLQAQQDELEKLRNLTTKLESVCIHLSNVNYEFKKMANEKKNACFFFSGPS